MGLEGKITSLMEICSLLINMRSSMLMSKKDDWVMCKPCQLLCMSVRSGSGRMEGIEYGNKLMGPQINTIERHGHAKHMNYCCVSQGGLTKSNWTLKATTECGEGWVNGCLERDDRRQWCNTMQHLKLPGGSGRTAHMDWWCAVWLFVDGARCKWVFMQPWIMRAIEARSNNVSHA
jgi:hypothetical protein